MACPFCGTNLAAVAPGGSSSDIPQAASPIPNEQTGPFSSPPGELPIIGKTARRVGVFVIALLVIGAIAALIYFVTPQVRRQLGKLGGDDADVTTDHGVFPRPDDTAKSGGGSGKDGGGDSSNEYETAAAVVRDLRGTDAACKRYDDVVNTTVVSAGVCYFGTEIWTIQVFLDDLSYDAVVSNYVASDTVHVAYGGNWTILTQTKSSAKKIASALDGRGK